MGKMLPLCWRNVDGRNRKFGIESVKEDPRKWSTVLPIGCGNGQWFCRLDAETISGLADQMRKRSVVLPIRCGSDQRFCRLDAETISGFADRIGSDSDLELYQNFLQQAIRFFV